MFAERTGVDTKPLRITGAPGLPANLAATTIVRDIDTGVPLAVVARMPADLLARYRRAALDYPPDTTVRAGGIRNKSRTFGFTSRNAMMQRNVCRACGGSIEAPGEHAVLCEAAGPLFALLDSLEPNVAQAARDAVLPNVLPEWRMHPDAPWTSGVLNFTSPLPYHFDGNNFDAWSAMVVLRRNVEGGHLSIPEYGLVAGCRDGDVVYFNGSSLLHGVTPMRLTKRDGYRLTAVYYPVRKMAKCLPGGEELAHGRSSRSAAEDNLIERQTRSGLKS